MNPIDLNIQRRLQELKNPIDCVPTDDELRERLRLLKDLPSKSSIQNKVILPQTKSVTEQADDLMRQFTDEISIDNYCASPTSVEEINKRLQKLKSHKLSTKPSSEDKEHSLGSETKMLLKKILSESELEKKTELLYHFNKSGKRYAEHMETYDAEEEFCTLCAKRPMWMCTDCEKPFCVRCYDEYHNEYGERHRREVLTGQRNESFESEDYSD